MTTPLSRRTFLRAAGVAIALPLLETMSRASANNAVAPPKRAVFICTTLGLHPPSLFPKTTGLDYESTEYLDILKKHRDKLTLISGLSHKDQSGLQGHSCEMTWLSAARNPALDGFRNTISVDQFAAEKLGHVTRFPSISLSSNGGSSQSYTSGGVMIPAESSSSRLFAKLFLQGSPTEIEKQKRQLHDGQSILDGVMSQTKTLRRKASADDRKRLDEYLQSVRTAEHDLVEAQAWLKKPKPKVDAEQPQDILSSADIIGRVQLLMNLIPLIVQTDSSRVVTVMIQDHFVVPKVAGVSMEHHNLSHHGQDPAKIAELKKIETALLGCYAGVLDQLTTKKEADGTLLDNTMTLFGSNLGNANAHDPHNLPILLAGGGLPQGGHIAYDRENNKLSCNLFVRMLNQMEIETNSFAQSTGNLTW